MDLSESVNQDSSTLAAKPSEPQPGEVLADKYELRGLIGRGGFGLVYDALDLGIGRQVALKVLLPEWASKDPELAIRFRREAVLASQLRHPNTITLYDYGQTDDNILYMAMEFVDGRTLSAVLREEAPITAERVVHILGQILASLKEAHHMGIVHRDLKPGNIMLTSFRGDSEYVKVLDFGIAKALSPDLLGGSENANQTLTQAGQFCGTPRYMAPEQFRNGEVTPSCDLYSLGLISYEMLTGKPAIVGETMVDLIVQQVAGPALVLPDTLDLSPDLRRCLQKALRKEPKARHSSAEVFLEALEGTGGHEEDPVFDEEGAPTVAYLSDDPESTLERETAEEIWDSSFNADQAGLISAFSDPFGTAPPDETSDAFKAPPEEIPSATIEKILRVPDSPQINISDHATSTSTDSIDPDTFDEPITEELMARSSGPSSQDTTTELSRSSVIGTGSDMAPTIDISRREIYDELGVSQTLESLPRPGGGDLDATIDMPLDLRVVQADLARAHQALTERKMLAQQEGGAASLTARDTQRQTIRTTTHAKAVGSGSNGRSGWLVRALTVFASLLVLVVGSILVIQATRYAWDNGLASRLGRTSTGGLENGVPGASDIILDGNAANPITITVLSKPSRAKVFIDNEQVGTTPVNLIAERGRSKRLQVKLDDHIGYTAKLTFRKSRVLSLELTPAR